MSAEITSTVWGIAPWSDELLKVSGDVERGRADLADETRQDAADFGTYHEVLAAAGIDYRSSWAGGKRDYFRGLVVGSHGFREGITEAPVTRWFDTNTFFRQPTIEGPLHNPQAAGHGYHQAFLEAADHPSAYQPTYLSPYAFARLADRGADVSEANAHSFIGDLYDELLNDAERQAVTHVLFHEPYAPYHQIDKLERAKLKHDIGSLAANHPSLKVGVYFSFGDGTEFIRDFAADDRLDAIGCDLQRTPIEGLIQVPDHRFLAGIVDGANTLVRDDEEIIAELEALEAAIEAPEVSVTHTIDLEHLPRAYAFEKIAQIGRIARATGVEDE